MKILIVEDEQQTAALLKELIESREGHSVLASLDSIAGTVDYLQQHSHDVDLIFMDIHLADGLCFQIFDKVSFNIPIVFCTAYDEYFLEAFENNGISYILKPFEDEDIFTALARVGKLKKIFSGNLAGLGDEIRSLIKEEKSYQKTMLVHVGETMRPVEIESVLVFHLMNETVTLYCDGNDKYRVLKRLDEIESVLDETRFFRINRQMIVNRRAVKEIEPYFNRKVVVKTTVALPEKAIVSRLKVTPFLQWVEKPI